MLILDINKVSKDFGFGPIFEDLSFSLNEGEKISIIGSNGGGKSTLLKMIAQIEKCDGGTISIKKMQEWLIWTRLLRISRTIA